MSTLIQAVIRYAAAHANYDGLAITPVDGMRLMSVSRPTGPLHSIYRPLVCFVLQGAKRMVAAGEEQLIRAGQSDLVTIDLPVTGRVVEASDDAPYAAIAVELDVSLVREIVSETGSCVSGRAPAHQLFVVDFDDAALDCVTRPMRLLDTPAAIPALRPGIMKELHYWLVEGRHGEIVRQLGLPDGQAARIGSAMRLLRTEYRQRLSLDRLAAAAGMSVSTFGRRFKAMTSLTPLQFQKELRLVEARRLMLGEGVSATAAAFAVGYESAAHFTRDYTRLFGRSPRRDARGHGTPQAGVDPVVRAPAELVGS